MPKFVYLLSIVLIMISFACAEENNDDIKILQQKHSSSLKKTNASKGIKSKQFDLLNEKIIKLEKDLLVIQKEVDRTIDFQMQSNESAINSVNTSISGASYAIMVFGLLITLGGVILGVFVTKQVRHVERMVEQSKEALRNLFVIRDEVRNLDNNIKSNIQKIYNDLKEEETKALIDRLCEEPEDIHNLFSVLTSRDIPKELYRKLKRAYKTHPRDIGIRGDNIEHYLTLFLQHFPELALFDEDLKEEIESQFPTLMERLYASEMKKITGAFFRQIINKGPISNYKDDMVYYFKGLQCNYRHNCEEIRQYIYKILSTKENRLSVCSILLSEPSLNDTAIIFGGLILNDYSDSLENTSSENEALLAIQQKIEEQKEK